MTKRVKNDRIIGLVGKRGGYPHLNISMRKLGRRPAMPGSMEIVHMMEEIVDPGGLKRTELQKQVYLREKGLSPDPK